MKVTHHLGAVRATAGCVGGHYALGAHRRNLHPKPEQKTEIVGKTVQIDLQIR